MKRNNKSWNVNYKLWLELFFFRLSQQVEDGSVSPKCEFDVVAQHIDAFDVFSIVARGAASLKRRLLRMRRVRLRPPRMSHVVQNSSRKPGEDKKMQTTQQILSREKKLKKRPPNLFSRFFQLWLVGNDFFAIPVYAFKQHHLSATKKNFKCWKWHK